MCPLEVVKGTAAAHAAPRSLHTWQSPHCQLAMSGSWQTETADLPPSPLRPPRGRPTGAGASNNYSRRCGELWHLPLGRHPGTPTILVPVRWPLRWRQPWRAAHGARLTRCATSWRWSPPLSVRTAHNGMGPPPPACAWPVRAWHVLLGCKEGARNAHEGPQLVSQLCDCKCHPNAWRTTPRTLVHCHLTSRIQQISQTCGEQPDH